MGKKDNVEMRKTMSHRLNIGSKYIYENIAPSEATKKQDIGTNMETQQITK